MRLQRQWVFRVPQIKNRKPFLFQSQASRSFCQLQSKQQQEKRYSSFGIAFDIDGVILRGRVPIGGSPQALRRLYGDSGSLKVPFLFLTNGGGIPECRRAIELSEILGVKILPSQVLQGHSPFKNLLKRYENQLIIATGKGEPALVMSEYGFKKVLSLEEYASFFENIDPVSQYKRWTTDQVLCDVLRSGGLPGQDNGHQPPLYFAADDLEYQVASMFIYFNLVRLYVPFQAAFPSQRLGMGAFRIALESVFNRIHHNALEYVSFGKPNPFVFKNAEAILSQLQLCCHEFNFKECGGPELPPLKTLYMIGDNPSVDVKGAHQAGNPWFSILTRTGVFRGESNHAEFPADLVVDTVEEAVDYILRRECSII
ncbi:hypothetical protein MANES_10G040600v8 [Manihot esculenta]|uniref:Uncharacterized protein n=3 Tax=Manihot esculenta TaxID=3983 RepID=A0ACB7GYZ8_MANES|nr:hypothetical protein MANES_10G040600v8 [Manihot esculenta]KAG8645195.1 hypothetical protein MANES_10G040600v8 [Manihot esculenta]KAG8645196.1 hypothetical protein MANES_10G040600v8 [Manihot esculenta]